jgi:hypothetical protein
MAITISPQIERVLKNHLGRCEDRFEAEARPDSTTPDELRELVAEFKRCKCLVMQAIRDACGGQLPVDLLPDWEGFACDSLV